MATLHSDGQASVDARLAAVVEETRALIAKFGWSVIAVFPTEAGDGVPFAYTVGLTAMQLPELAIYGLQPRVAHSVLNVAAKTMVEAGVPFVAGQRISGVLAGDVSLVAVEMNRRTEDLGRVGQVYGSVGAAVQLCWPDVDGLFPWESGSCVGESEQPVWGAPPSGRRVYRATRLPVESTRELVDLAAETPVVELGLVDPQADNDYRALRGAQALIGYVRHLGMDCADAEVETTAADMLADLRHLFDALGLEWEQGLSSAEGNYRAEILGEL